MRFFKLILQFDGTGYCGWQLQRASRAGPAKPSVQSTLQRVLGGILQQQVKVIGCGRTDAGVHADGFVAHFSARTHLPAARLRAALNALLPGDIAVVDVREVPASFHSRYRCRSKTYRYSLDTRDVPDVFSRRWALHCPWPLDLARMRREARILAGEHDFGAFASGPGKRGGTVRRIDKISIVKRGRMLYIIIRGNGFLRHMVRALVGTLLEIGRGKMPSGSMRAILKGRSRRAAGPTAAAKGLCLIEASYAGDAAK